MNLKREFRSLKIKLRIACRKMDFALFEHMPILNCKYNAIRVAYHKRGEDLKTYLLRFLQIKEKDIGENINSGKLLVNYRKVHQDYLLTRDELILIDRKIKIKKNRVADLSFSILKETEKYLIIDKPAGIKVHSNYPDDEDSILECLKKSGKIDAPKYIYYESNIVHRLDKYTSGPIIIAKHQKYAPILKKLFKKRNIDKYYFAITHGKFIDKSGIIEFPLIRGYDALYGDYMIISGKPYKWAKTLYKIIDSRNGFSLVKLKIITGRTHQIRVHMSVIGHPICGDTFYSTFRDNRFPRQMLHSYLLKFTDPFTKEKVKVVSPLPEDMRNVLKEVYYEFV